MARASAFGIDDPVDLRLVAGAYDGDVAAIVAALAAGARVDVPSAQGWTPLMWLAMRALVAREPVPCARWLVAAGAEVNRFVPAADGSVAGDTPLTLACEAGDADLVAFLLANDADLDPPDGAFPPLHAALPSERTVRMLLAAGADRRRRFRGRTALERYVEGWGDPQDRDEAHFAAMARLLA